MRVPSSSLPDAGIGKRLVAVRADLSGDPSVARLDELDRALTVLEVRVREKLDRGSELLHQVLQEEEVHITGEVAEQPKKSAYGQACH
jgi:hypothetical protein